ncbi:hypothetical protein [Sporosarcina sp. NCCP-2222]|nr:hypothetical protein [Sporosarcina sp. NCCP-2222]
MYEIKDSYFIVIDPLFIIISVVTVLLVVTAFVFYRRRVRQEK